MNAWNAARPPTRGQVTRMISELLGSRPSATAAAGDGEWAAWFSRKAEVFDRIADLNARDGDVVRAGEARHLAAEARAQAAARTRTHAAPALEDAAGEVAGDVEEDREAEAAVVERRQWEVALQVADDRDVVYGDGTAGPARLLRDPVDILADHATRTSPTTSSTASTAAGTASVVSAGDVDEL